MDIKQFIYTLKLVPRLIEEHNWTEADIQIVQEHFHELKRLTEENTVILAGRTLNEDETTFGIVILQTTSEQEAREVMESDPAVKKGIMTATLYPYRIALFNKKFAG